jgi:hypothetical protein
MFVDKRHSTHIMLRMNNLRTLRDHVITREEAQVVLKPHVTTIEDCVMRGFERWKDFAIAMPEHRLMVVNRTMSNMVNDFVVHYAREAFQPSKGVRPFEEFGFFCVSFDERVLLRFKKLDDDDTTSNIPTDQQIQISCQQLEIPGSAPATWIAAGWHFSALRDQIDKVLITCHFGPNLIWALPVFDPQSEGAGTIRFPTEQRAPGSKKSRVKAKNIVLPEGQ